MSVHPSLIGGEWVSGAPAPNLNPSDLSDVVGEYGQVGIKEAEAAVAAARAAFPAWSRGGVQARAELLDRIGTEILARRAELADLLSREEGKTLAEATGEVTRAGNIFKFFAGEVVRIRGETMASVRPGVQVEITREPVGVVALICPWNFPIAIPAWKIAPALAYGNCVVFKPADLTPGSAWALAEIIHRAGAPAGVFNLVMGRGSALGPAFTGPGVDAVSFTGSTGVGTRILKAAVENGIKVQLEMGGKNPLVVLDDADLDVAVRCALDGAYFGTGQRCTASSRLVVQTGIHDRFVAALAEAMRAQVVDDARAAGTTIGPVVDQSQLDQDLSYIEIAEGEGARRVEGGERLQRAAQGFYLSPALFVDTTPAMRINREEVFGPVASVIRVKDYDEALATANDTPFGLCAGVCTTSLKHASHFKRNAETGMVMVNLPTAGVDYHVPFGGRKSSSYGSREQGAYAAEFYTTVKTAYVNPS
ncbi:MAG TPA: aldehyde dehydrogenase family protein [Caulobacteraceae bacterium]|jgi:aldehyde dehydrogenase (NAD+)|nr:aldehyde dehydrogenase family protein [Caulobacteraceae bacterium]